MKTLAFLTLFLAFSGHAEIATPNPISRYFRKVPIEKAHVTWGDASVSSLPSKGLDVLVWNVKKGDRPTFASEFMKFGENKDMFLIQEAFTAPYFTATLETFRDYQWDLGISFTYRMYNDDGTGNMIGARVKPTWVMVEHTLDLEPLTETPKTTAYATFSVEGIDKELLVISIHGINFTGFGAFSRHLDQVYEKILNHNGPVILAGDFNTRTKDRYREVQALARALSLDEVEFINGDRRMVAVGTKNILDHAFVRGFKITHAEVHPSPGSDHKPMVISLDVKTNYSWRPE